MTLRSKPKGERSDLSPPPRKGAGGWCEQVPRPMPVYHAARREHTAPRNACHIGSRKLIFKTQTVFDRPATLSLPFCCSCHIPHSLSHALSHALSHSHSHSHSRSRSRSHSHSHSHSHSQSHSLTHSLTLSLVHSLTRSLSHSFTHSLTLSLSQSLILT